MRYAITACRMLLFLAFCMISSGQEAAHKFAYDKTKEAKLEGTVFEVVKQDGCEVKPDSGTHLRVLDPAAPKPAPGATPETIDVFAGPTWFLKEMDINLAKDDKVEMTGVWFTLNEKKMFVARLIKKNKDEYLLRDETGAPVWTWLDGYKTCKAADAKKN